MRDPSPGRSLFPLSLSSLLRIEGGGSGLPVDFRLCPSSRAPGAPTPTEMIKLGYDDDDAWSLFVGRGSPPSSGGERSALLRLSVDASAPYCLAGCRGACPERGDGLAAAPGRTHAG